MWCMSNESTQKWFACTRAGFKGPIASPNPLPFAVSIWHLLAFTALLLSSCCFPSSPSTLFSEVWPILKSKCHGRRKGQVKVCCWARSEWLTQCLDAWGCSGGEQGALTLHTLNNHLSEHTCGCSAVTPSALTRHMTLIPACDWCRHESRWLMVLQLPLDDQGRGQWLSGMYTTLSLLYTHRSVLCSDNSRVFLSLHLIFQTGVFVLGSHRSAVGFIYWLISIHI